MDTKKYGIKKINRHGKGTMVYLSAKDREHIEVIKDESIIFDKTVPGIIKIMSIDKWKRQEGRNFIYVRK